MTPSKRQNMTTIWVEKDLVEQLKKLGKMGDTYSAVIRRLLDGNKPEGEGKPHGDRKDVIRGSTH